MLALASAFYWYSLTHAVSVGLELHQCFLQVHFKPSCWWWLWGCTSANLASGASVLWSGLHREVASQGWCFWSWAVNTGTDLIKFSCKMICLLMLCFLPPSGSLFPLLSYPVSSSVTGLKRCRSFQKQTFRSFTAQQREVRMLSIILFGVYIFSGPLWGFVCRK